MGVMERFAAMPRGGVDPAAGVRVREGTMAEFEALGRLHYRAGKPGVVVRVMVAEAGEETSTLAHEHTRTSERRSRSYLPVRRLAQVPVSSAALVGVLTVSMPTLNGRWREAAWPGRYSTQDRAADARRLNREVRLISRVIVDPRWRGLGIATRLVRGYLSRPLTEKTEAVAAMGACCPFFERAGMRAWRLEPDRRGARLMRALRGEGMEAWELCGRSRVSAALERELRMWANGSRATRGLVEASVGRLCRAAAGTLSGAVAYTWEH